MPDRPLLRLPDGAEIAPPNGPTAREKVNLPTRDRQRARLAPKFVQLAQAIAPGGDPLLLREDAEAIAPERAIVFEVAGSVVDFYAEAAALGLEYLADDEIAFAADDDFRLLKHPERVFDGRVYMAMPNLQALRQLIRVWTIYSTGGRMLNGFGMWTKLFARLKDVRAWGPEDRVLPETIAAWQDQLAEAPDAAVRFEVELWFRDAPAQRTRAMAALRGAAQALGGMVLHEAAIEAIRYHAALVELPARQVEALVQNKHVSLGLLDDIMFVRPQSLALADKNEDPEGQPANDGGHAPPAALPPIAALLDGFPVQNHVRLARRLEIDDPDGFEQGYAVALRRHGTEMASLIVNGDLNADEAPLSRPLYVQPVMRPSPAGVERTPADRLLVDVIYRAVRRMKVGDGNQAATAPGVLLVNLSLGDLRRPFAGPMSPWARLLDYLAYEYRVLFLVSAGNITETIAVPEYDTWAQFEEANEELRDQAVLRAVHANRARRTLLSPAESLNTITVGAAHDDSIVNRRMPLDAKPPWSCEGLPNLSSALGLGHRLIVKPDIFMNGGRELVRRRSTHPLVIEPVRVAQGGFGLLAAAPDAGGNTARTALCHGTSAATALATRTGHQIHDALMDVAGGSMHADVPEQYRALLIKALLVHGASWGDSSALVEGVFGPHGQHDHNARKDNVARFLGYGRVDVPRVLACTRNRATLLGQGEVVPGNAKLHRFPLPASLDGARDFRAVTVTVAWFSPVNPRHQGYRMTALEAGPGGEAGYSLALDRASAQPNFNAVKRGSVFHERREGERAAAFVDDGDLLLRVSCRATAGTYDQPVPYAVAISVEVGVESRIEAYAEVRAALEQRILAQQQRVQG
jgi:hypothetical protein